MSRRDNDLQLFKTLFGEETILPHPPDWVARAIGRRLRCRELTIVSAVCPDYARENGAFTYRALGRGVPFTAREHLLLIQRIHNVLQRHGVSLRYVMTLADTEFDLPLVLQSLTNGSAEEFLSRCQQSCSALEQEARNLNIPLESCQRFTEVFPRWFEYYTKSLMYMEQESRDNSSTASDLHFNSAARLPLYQAMAGRKVSSDYCRNMVLRQWAQYATWGELATQQLGKDLVMINHRTPNLSCVNSPFFREGRERIPIIELNITTMPA